VFLDRYLDEVRGRAPGPLFLTRQKKRITERVVAYIFDRLSNEASAQLPEAQRFRVTPHQARHTFLKRVADKEGVHVAQEMSGNISISEIFRYTKPSEDEIEAVAERAF
jgi:integrase/recombinase XerD